jgi:alpha/beta superfamily hydrolase
LDGGIAPRYSLGHMISEDSATLATRDGVTLEAQLGLPPDPGGGVVICHPHPLYGGDMDNPVVVRVAEVCREARLATLRFNFRGVGASTGQHGDGRDERHDVAAALAHLSALLPTGAPLGLAGYSFGAFMAAQVASEPSGLSRLTAVALIAPPLARTGDEPFAALAPLAIRLLVVAGDHDEYCPLPALQALGRQLPSAEIKVIEGANHFFFGKLYPLGQAVADWSRALEARQAGRRHGAG